MGTTLWVLQQTSAGMGDDRDHSLFFDSSEALDKVASTLGVRKLSDFFDTADFDFNMSDEGLPESWISEHQKWHSPADVLPSLTAIIEHLQSADVPGIPADIRADLVDELEDCRTKIEAARAAGDAFHFCVVM